jgi:hypothetical protein
MMTGRGHLLKNKVGFTSTPIHNSMLAPLVVVRKSSYVKGHLAGPLARGAGERLPLLLAVHHAAAGQWSVVVPSQHCRTATTATVAGGGI